MNVGGHLHPQAALLSRGVLGNVCPGAGEYDNEPSGSIKGETFF
jgi:hypothetical protein